MTASGLEKSDLGKNRFYTSLNMPYPTGKIIAAQTIHAVYWLVNEIISRSARQYSAHIVVRKKHLSAKYLG